MFANLSEKAAEFESNVLKLSKYIHDNTTLYDQYVSQCEVIFNDITMNPSSYTVLFTNLQSASIAGDVYAYMKDGCATVKKIGVNI